MAHTESKLDTLIGPETRAKGDLNVNGCLRLDGHIEGDLEVAESFMAGPRSLLKGGLRCRDAVLAGRIEGDITAAESVELQTGAEVFGNITCGGLVIQRGCVFQGTCTMRQPGK
jgi:cytoskeletal protein CcmA (bactofilin family)